MDDIVTGGGGAAIYRYSGEPDLQASRRRGRKRAARRASDEAGPTIADNPHHFVVIQVDGDRLSLEVVGIAGTTLAPYSGHSHILLSDRELTDAR